MEVHHWRVLPPTRLQPVILGGEAPVEFVCAAAQAQRDTVIGDAQVQLAAKRLGVSRLNIFVHGVLLEWH
ncbi:hypothetical protein D3C76_1799080 [compost metagenome]